MNCLRMSCVVLVVGLAARSLFGAGGPKPPQNVPASPALSAEARAGDQGGLPRCDDRAAKLNMDRGLQVYYVELTGDKSVSSVEVTATAPVMVIQAALKVEQKDLPAAVAKAAAAAAAGATFASAEKLEIRADFTPREFLKSAVNYKLVPLTAAVTAYDVTYVNQDGVKGVVRLDADGKVLAPMNWMKRASAMVPPGKLVIRVHLGRLIDYTDRSGVVWSADRVYSKENGWGALGGRPGGRLNLSVLGTDAPFVYDGERDKEGAYRFDVPNGVYTVRMHFCESWDGAQPGLREFGIKIQGKKVVDKMDISGTAGGWLIPLVKEFKERRSHRRQAASGALRQQQPGPARQCASLRGLCAESRGEAK